LLWFGIPTMLLRCLPSWIAGTPDRSKLVLIKQPVWH
jgi:hypothetical protein